HARDRLADACHARPAVRAAVPGAVFVPASLVPAARVPALGTGAALIAGATLIAGAAVLAGATHIACVAGLPTLLVVGPLVHGHALPATANRVTGAGASVGR